MQDWIYRKNVNKDKIKFKYIFKIWGINLKWKEQDGNNCISRRKVKLSLCMNMRKNKYKACLIKRLLYLRGKLNNTVSDWRRVINVIRRIKLKKIAFIRKILWRWVINCYRDHFKENHCKRKINSSQKIMNNLIQALMVITVEQKLQDFLE